MRSLVRFQLAPPLFPLAVALPRQQLPVLLSLRPRAGRGSAAVEGVEPVGDLHVEAVEDVGTAEDRRRAAASPEPTVSSRHFGMLDGSVAFVPTRAHWSSPDAEVGLPSRTPGSDARRSGRRDRAVLGRPRASRVSRLVDACY